jgi:histidyl-tRNA synthetase
MEEVNFMAIELKNLKGTGDYMPKEQKVRQAILTKLQGVFEKYGYQQMDTPVLCFYDLLASKYAGGAEILKEVYKLSDQGSRNLALRYDLTVPFAKVIGMNPELQMPFKRYEIGRVYRDGPVKTGRNREFIQCDVDMAGVRSVLGEAELLVMAVEIYKMLGLDIFIAYNNRKLLSGILQSVGIGPLLLSKVILVLDKLEKASIPELKRELLELGIRDVIIDELFCYMQMKPGELLSAIANLPENELLKQGMEEINELNQYLDALGIRSYVRFTPNLARGLEIYTGTVWEVFLTDRSIPSSVGAGGRYDDIIGAFLDNGGNYPAVGMTFGVDVIYEALAIKGSVKSSPPVDLYIIPIGTEAESLKMVTLFRNEGIRTDFEMSGKRLKKSLDYANKLGIPYVAVIGENELSSRILKLKEMATGKEYPLPLDNIVAEMKTIICGTPVHA